MVGLDAEVVDGDVVAGGDGADAIEYALGAGFAGNGVDDNIGAGQRTVDRIGGRLHELACVLEGETAGQREGEVSEIPGTGATHAGLLDGHDALDLLHFADQTSTGLGRDFVHEYGNGFAAEPESETQDHDGNDDCGEGVSVFEPRDGVVRSEPTGAKAAEDGECGPDVAGEVECIGRKRG